MKLFSRDFFVRVILVGLFLGVPCEAHAVFLLNATPTRETHGIRFDDVKPGSYARNEEVTITMTSTVTTQYTIYQEMNQPLTNETGAMIPQRSLIVFSPSSSLGTLKTQQETPVLMGRTPIYTSNGAGDTDTFVLVFNIMIPEGQPGGLYRTMLKLIAQPVSSQPGVSQSTVILNVVVNVRPTFSLNIQNSRGLRQIDLGRISRDRLVADDTLSVVVESNSAAYTIFQEMAEPLTSQDGQIINEADLKLVALGGDKGVLTAKNSPVSVPSNSERVYVSDSGLSDSFALKYIASPDSTQKAGIYSGTVKLKVDSAAQNIPLQPVIIPIQLEVEPIFYLDIELPEVTKVSFGVFKNANEVREKTVTVKVHSNLNEPYQVVQIVSNKITSPQGHALPPQNFTYFGSEAQTGTLANLSPVAVREGSEVVYTSNPRGAPEKFILTYALKTSESPKAGPFSTIVKYSLTTV